MSNLVEYTEGLLYCKIALAQSDWVKDETKIYRCLNVLVHLIKYLTFTAVNDNSLIKLQIIRFEQFW